MGDHKTETADALGAFVSAATTEADEVWAMKERHRAGDHSTCPPDWCLIRTPLGVV